VIPDSCRSNFRPFYLHPPHAPLSYAHCARRRPGRGVAASLSGSASVLGFTSLPRVFANASGRIEFIIFLIMDWSFASGCSPPRLSTTQLPSATDSQCSVRWGLPPHCWCALSGARGPDLRAGRLGRAARRSAPTVGYASRRPISSSLHRSAFSSKTSACIFLRRAHYILWSIDRPFINHAVPKMR
jgi:hypothetical protein